MLGTIFATRRQRINAVIALLLTFLLLGGYAIYQEEAESQCDATQASVGEC